jgi:hypothetical protein
MKMEKLIKICSGKAPKLSKLLKILLFWSVFIFVISVSKKIFGSSNSNADFIAQSLTTFFCTIAICGAMFHFLSVNYLKLSIPLIWILTVLQILL